jgi:hypothetical protein
VAGGCGGAGTEGLMRGAGLDGRTTGLAPSAGAIFRRTSRRAGRPGPLGSCVDISVPVSMDHGRVARPLPQVVFVTQGRLRKSPGDVLVARREWIASSHASSGKSAATPSRT